jgi:hypothetical protein
VRSVNVGLPREVVWRGKPIRTGIYKEPVAGRVSLRRTNLEGPGVINIFSLDQANGEESLLLADSPPTTYSVAYPNWQPLAKP